VAKKKQKEKKMKKFFIIMIAVVLLGMWTQAQTVDEIVQKYIKAMGGADKINAIKTLKLEGKFMRQGMEATLTIWSKHPDMIKMDLDISGQKMITAYDGKIGWMINPFSGSTEPEEMSKEDIENMNGNADMVNNPLVDYKKKGHKIELIGKEDMEGTEVFKLKLTRKNNRVTFLYLDTENCIILKTSETRKISGQEFKNDMLYGDYKPVAGILMPHSLEPYGNDQSLGALKIDSFEPNIKLEDDFFKMPKVEKKEEEKK
jgi:outer membrane lipoprotein-sorting protein